MQVRANITHQLRKINKAHKICESITAKGRSIAEYRLRIIEFYDKHGLSAAREAFNVSKSTIYNWKGKLKTAKGTLKALIPESTAPCRKRQSKVNDLIKQFIIEYRNKYGAVTQETIKPALDIHCTEKGIKTVSTATIGRIIRELREQGKIITKGKRYTLNGRSGKIKFYSKKRIKKERRKGYQPKSCGDLLQIDSVHLFSCGVRKYLITAICLKSRFTFSCTYERLNSLNAKDFINKLRKVLPFEISRIQTDNGSEFAGYFSEYLKEEGITHFYNYPRYPKGNAYIERFNRTIREQCVNMNMDWIDDTQGFNRKLMEYLLWYNGERPHKGLKYKTPLDYVANELTDDSKKSNPQSS